MGRAAAADIAAAMRQAIAAKDRVRMIFASAPSQQEMLDALVRESGIDWRRVTAFHMDEYHTLPPTAPQRFGPWLERVLFDRVPIGTVHLMTPEADAAACIRDYTRLLAEAPIDIVCLGIGVNGHLAFNDPPVADLADPVDVKIIELDPVCRRQQVDDGGFARIEDVPPTALTLTIPRLLRAERLFCVVPGPAKRDALRRTLDDPIGTACPATALRTHPNCILYCDAAALPEA
ncbi:MAG: glucosamine-6-phosphate deaminase [Alphaproteobacteria bacterium]|nr:glucosamine-6-phosphate deaminase [Alphaproteobacteria bacterium]